MENTMSLFRESMGRLASGVSVVTTTIDNRPWGLTVSACASISMEPPLLMISLASRTASADAILKNRQFGVSILSQEQLDVAKFGAQQGKPKYFDDFINTNDISNGYVIKNALANIHCEVNQTVTAGDHTIFIGAVKHVELGEVQDPLLYYYRKFGSFTSDPNELMEGIVKWKYSIYLIQLNKYL